MSTKHANTFTITIGDDEVEVDVHWVYYPPCRGARDSLGGVRGAGPPLEPDEPADIDIEEVFGPNGTAIEVDDATLDHIRDLVWEHIASIERDREPPDPPEVWEYERE